MSEAKSPVMKTETKTLHCDEHGDYEATAFDFFGRQRFSPCPDCKRVADERRAAEEQEQAERERIGKIRLLIRRASIPPRFANRTFDNFRAETDGQRKTLTICRRYADNFEERVKAGTSLLFCGPPGTGKTHLAAAIANTIAHGGFQPLFISVLSAVRRVKETYNRNSETTEQQAIDAFLAPDLLILDEVGVQFGSETEQMILFEIINGRYEHMLPTLLISNLDREGVTGYLGARVMDRLMEGGGATIAFKWESYRAKVADDPELGA